MSATQPRVVLLGIDGMATQDLESYVRLGQLPHLAELMNSGVYSHALPAMTAKTPQNWATLATGANPGRHGIIDLFMQEHDQPFGKSKVSDFHNGFSSQWLRTGPSSSGRHWSGRANLRRSSTTRALTPTS